MSCTFEEDLTAYVDGELAGLRARQVEQHLGGCAGCRATDALLRRTVSQLRLLPAFEPSVGMRRSVLHRIDERASVGERLRAFLQPGILMPSAGLAAAALVAVSLNAGLHASGPEPMDGTQLELARNLEVAENYEVLGLESADDAEVVQHLQELEMQP